ncbi:MAG: hypothetical protein ACLFV4_02480 [Candidatus Hydrogenedentota bacterium]
MHPTNPWSPLTLGACLALAVLLAAPTHADEVMLFDFREDDHGWHGNPRVENFRQDPDDGLVFDSVDVDPWIEGPPPENLPLGVELRLAIRMRSTGDATAQVLYGPEFEAGRQVSFTVRPDGEWHEYEAVLPPQEEGNRLRIDPAHAEGSFAVQWIKAEPLTPLAEVPLPAPESVEIPEDAETLEVEGVTLRHGERWNAFELLVDGERMAASLVNDRIGYAVEDESAFLDLREADVSVQRMDDELTVEAAIEDAHGGLWTLRRTFRPHPAGRTVEAETAVEVDEDREVFHMPWMTLFPGFETFGESKTQAILPGVDYLGEDEPSSSTKSFEDDQAERRIVEDYKLTAPYMAVTHEDRYVGLAWERDDHPAPVFDSPDRLHESEAHLMALWHPGVGDRRRENEVSPLGAAPFHANEPQTRTVQLFGGQGATVADVARHYADYKGELPAVPEIEGGAQHAIRLLAAGWLDSEGHQDGLFRHAVWEGFGAQAAAEAPAQMLWLAEHTEDSDLAERLRQGAERGLERLSPASNYAEGIGHVNRPVAPLLFGRIEGYVEERVASARDSLRQFDEDGIRRYSPPADGPDYSRTHWEDHANGHTFIPLENMLEAAAFSGDEALIEDALELLDKQAEHYAGTVPRGAQTWEMPLHTPDILASARALRSYVLGYKLTGDEGYLDEARYWAWTGAPFVYFDYPTDGPIGLYATIAVLGATNWVAPNWIGQPVQWCGLVYRSALHELAEVDGENGPFWDKLARGITASGVQQTFPLEDEERQGLLPDFTILKTQVRDGPAITPATVQTNLAERYGLTPWFDSKRVTDEGALAFAPGGIDGANHEDGALTLEIEGWPSGEYAVRLSRLPGEPDSVTWNGEPADIQFDPERNGANITVEGGGVLVIEGI